MGWFLWRVLYQILSLLPISYIMLRILVSQFTESKYFLLVLLLNLVEIIDPYSITCHLWPQCSGSFFKKSPVGRPGSLAGTYHMTAPLFISHHC